ncbi:AMP-binding protein [Cerasicoccus fimbriatus]|uniref:AMP-binding protein n=1 Tax=Cerasicoccus fimbriatus TaxID=3014554 RepID=UPI0022B5AA8A|nr:AMP-binding protein [Cerasicoccus sp. TK19100]
MGQALSRLQELVTRPWLACPEQQSHFAEAYAAAAKRLGNITAGPVVIGDADRVRFLASAFAAIEQGRAVFLASPAWGAHEWRQAEALIPPSAIVWSNSAAAERTFHGNFGEPEPGSILIPTGGTGGRIKFAVHTLATLMASVRGYQAHWSGGALNAICPLPVCHIGGLMLALRTALTGGRLWLCDARLEETPPPGFDLGSAHCSVVGAQLRRALDQGGHWLSQCRAVLVGGGPSAPELLRDAFEAGIPLYTAYGLTEAAATVALNQVSPGSDPAVGDVLPHWRVDVADGLIRLRGEALFRGYWGQAMRVDDFWETGDRGELLDGQLKVLGRAGRFIVTGGRKVDADLLEKRLGSWPEIDAALVFGAPHREWGEAVTAVVVSSSSVAELVAKAKEELMPEMRPKQWICVEAIPQTEHGKPDWPAIYSLMKST